MRIRGIIMHKQWLGVAVGGLLLLGAAGCTNATTTPTKATVNTTLTAAEAKSGRAIKAKAEAEATSASVAKAKAKAQADSKSVSNIADPDADATPTDDDNAVWNQSKSDALSDFMSSWGDTMNQQYQEYGPGDDVNFNGVDVPSDLDDMKPAVGTKAINIAWSTDGKTKADYALLTIYSDAEDDDRAGGPHLYFFVLHKGTPQVLITEQTQGNAKHLLYFHTTANTQLSGGFTKIINGD